MATIRMREALRDAMAEEMRRDESVFVMGEDVGVFQGAFKVTEGLLNMAEMAFRPYDPCHACGTHALPGEMPLILNIYDHNRQLVKKLQRDRV